MTTIVIDDTETKKLIEELLKRTSDIGPVQEGVGQILVSSTQLRFMNQAGPDGSPWAQLSAVTLSRRRKGGRGAQILRDTGRLMNSVTSKITDNEVQIGTNVIYAGTHQFGAKKGDYGKTKRNGPIPWGNIPARPFLGYNNEDNENVNELIQRYVDASQPRSWWQSFVDKFKRLFGG